MHRFLPHFPYLVDMSIDTMLDLCKDTAVDIRKQAIKDLPTLCRDNKANHPSPESPKSSLRSDFCNFSFVNAAYSDRIRIHILCKISGYASGSYQEGSDPTASGSRFPTLFVSLNTSVAPQRPTCSYREHTCYANLANLPA
jgi:Apoptosis inhibitory protein 5 (API5)